MADGDEASLRQRAMQRVMEGTSAEPLDEDDQQRVIEQFRTDIEKQFLALRKIMTAVTLAWVMIVILIIRKPELVCQFANAGALVSTDKPFLCPTEAVSLMRRTLGLVVFIHLTSFAYLQGGGERKVLLVGYAEFSVPLLLLLSATVFGVEKAQTELAADAKLKGGPAIDYSSSGSQVHMHIVLLLLATLVGLAVLIHFLCGYVYTSRKDLQDDLERLMSKKYRHKSL